MLPVLQDTNDTTVALKKLFRFFLKSTTTPNSNPPQQTSTPRANEDKDASSPRVNQVRTTSSPRLKLTRISTLATKSTSEISREKRARLRNDIKLM